MTSAPATEAADARYQGFDTWRDDAILAALLEGQQRALNSVAAAIPALSQAARAAAERLAGGGRLIYIAAGSPALMSLADALEIPQTYGVAYDRIVLVLADGEGIAKRLNGMREDDAEGARADMAAVGVGPGDCVIATSASGSTPYTVAGMMAAREAGAVTIGIAGNAGAKLLEAADIGVLLDAGPEVISGSTRMGAGTAQKAALNMLSTLMGVHLGHVYDGLMVNVKADNEKLRGRAARIVTKITGVDTAAAVRALELSGGEVKPAVLIAAGVTTPAEAGLLLGQTKGNLRMALAKIGATTPAI
ncbi:MAG: N-acetylmuramic acid 6-phosphate etherase [Devosia sp.]|uniref:N-acetylmuramic acid 6-phosphate etherase n=1 Tax=Devosia sp. TaxID=1871048 RepID=UPI002633BEB4|nr:N-acetylmuramic acid 6-phosphate etherase [Devosia sp.]MDB5542810.1 N-acetylmuramic acid 6-phosphate etherase [Devosia sp.]